VDGSPGRALPPRRWSRRRVTVLLVVVGSVLVLGGVFLWALPEIIRRTVVTQFPRLTGRAMSLEDIDLNLFTGRLALTKLRVAERDPAETFVQADRIAVRLVPFSLITGHLVLDEVAFTAPRIRIVRTGPREFNFSDLIPPPTPIDPDEPVGEWTLTIARLALVGGALRVADRAVSPAHDWEIAGLSVTADGLTTRGGEPPGRLTVRAQVNEATVEAAASAVVLAPVALTARLGLDRFDLALLRPYLPAGLPASLESGVLGLALQATVEGGGEGLTRATVSGDVRVEHLALAQPDHPAPFLKLPRLHVAIGLADLLAPSVTLAHVEVDGLDLRAERDPRGAIDLLSLAGPPAGAAAPGERPLAPATATAAPPAAAAPPFKVKLERLTVRSGAVLLEDQAVSPARQWRLSDLAIDGAGYSTSPEDDPASLKGSGQVEVTPGGRRATLSWEVPSVRLSPLRATASVALEGFDLGALGPYWPAALPAVVRDGALDVKASAAVAGNDTELTRAVASGRVRLGGLTLVRRGQASTPFLTVPTLTVEVRQADAMARTVDLRSIGIDGVDARVTRDAGGQIDLLDLLAAMPVEAPAPSAPAAPPPVTRAPPEWTITLERFDFARGTAVFEDRGVSPTTVLAVTELTASAERLQWPSTTPATFTASLNMPGGGRSEVKGQGQLDPLDVQIAISTRDAPIEPFQAYFPFPARFIGFFSGDSLNEFQRLPDGTLVLASRGDAWARDFEVRAPGATAPVARLARMEIQGIDFSWPNYALVKRVVLTKPEAQVERGADGVINLQRLFAPERAPAPKAAPATPAPATTAAAKPSEANPLEDMVIDFGEIASVDGYVRFLDRTTTPPFSTDLSAFTLTIRGASNQVGRNPITMTTRAKVGGDGRLEMEGQVSGTGEAFRADLAGDLQDFRLATANPYVEQFTSWVITRGTFSLRTRYRIEGDRLSADHDMLFGGLRVERSRGPDQGRQRLGVPLGLAVALLKDRRGNIDFSIPLRGTLHDQQFDWAEAMWAGARQVLVKLIVSPFSAIGRAFTSGGDTVESLEVDPVTFAAGSAVLAPPMEVHVTRVADFLRRAPSLTLTLRPAVSDADVDALKAEVVNDRLATLTRERGLADQAAAIKADAGERLADVTLPETVEAQLALLRSREPVPEGPLADLLKGRTEATRDRLVQAEGIPAERLKVTLPSPAAAAAAASGEGRVEFGLGAADE
jgi:uncharacterized protein involved in outer membrane biogenesis